jgi:excisionase family DNA binding protein
MPRSTDSVTPTATSGHVDLGSRERELVLRLSDELIDAIAERAAMAIAQRPGRSEDGWLRGANQIAAYIDCPRSRVYALTSARRIPVHRDGSALIARRSELDAWLRNGGGVRP